MSVALVRFPDDDRLDELAAQIDLAHRGFTESATAAVEHAIRAGELLLEARDVVPYGEWTVWLAHNVEVTAQHAQTYMRVARNAELVRRENPPSLKAANKLLTRASVRDVRVDPTLRLEAQRLRRDGLKHDEIAVELRFSQATISRWLNPSNEAKYRKKKAITSKAGRAALRRQERINDARKAGGSIAKSYGLIREVLDELQRAEAEYTGETRKSIKTAMHILYKVEDHIAKATRSAQIERPK
jgi:predicted transcriptional regulator